MNLVLFVLVWLLIGILVATIAAKLSPSIHDAAVGPERDRAFVGMLIIVWPPVVILGAGALAAGLVAGIIQRSEIDDEGEAA